MNVGRKGDPCPIAGCPQILDRLDGASLVCARGHRLVNLDYRRHDPAPNLSEKRRTELGTGG